jgi:hypothetical protein
LSVLETKSNNPLAKAFATMSMIDLRNLSTMGEKGVVNTLVRSLSLRLHVSLIIAFSWACGFLVTRQLHNFGVDSLAVRYSVALIAGYLAFLAGVRIWLWLVLGTEPATNNVADDRSSSNFDLPSFGGSAAPSGGGGGSGGAGASGDWESPAPAMNINSLGTNLGIGSSTGSSSGGGSGGGGGDGDGLGAILVIGFFVLVVVTYFAAIFYVVYVGPHLLGEAAFQFMLAGGLVKHARKTDASWTENVIKATWIPFAIVFIITVAFGLVAGNYFPEAHTMREVLHAAGL